MLYRSKVYLNICEFCGRDNTKTKDETCPGCGASVPDLSPGEEYPIQRVDMYGTYGYNYKFINGTASVGGGGSSEKQPPRKT